MPLVTCPYCGQAVSDAAPTCVGCGRPIAAPQPKRLGDDAVARAILPVGRSGWAIAAGYLGLVSVLVVPAPFALATGIIAIWDIRTHPHRHGMGRAVFGVIMGSLFTVLLLIYLLVK